MIAQASAAGVPRSLRSNRLTLWYRPVEAWSSTKSCQMPLALRPRDSQSAISSLWTSHALADGLRLGCAVGLAVGSAPESGDASAALAGFAVALSGSCRPRGDRKAIPAAFK